MTAPFAPPLKQPARAGTFRHDVHLFRGLAITLIVGLHALPSFIWDAHPRVHAAMDAALNQSSMLFFFISGYLFQHLSGRWSYGSFLRRKGQTVIMPYLVMSVPALVVSLFFIPQANLPSWVYEMDVARQLGFFLITGKHLETLWFVPAIAIYFVLSPVLIALDRRPGLYCLIPLLVLLSAAIGPNGPSGPVQKALYLLPAYLFGMFVSRHCAQVDAWTRRHLRAVLLMLSVLYAAIYAHLDLRWGVDLLIFFKLLSCPVLLLILSRVPEGGMPALATLGHYSFGIYFVHGYLYAAFRLLDTQLHGHPWTGNSALLTPTPLGLVLHAGLILAGSAAIVWAVKQVFGRHSRMVIGA